MVAEPAAIPTTTRKTRLRVAVEVAAEPVCRPEERDPELAMLVRGTEIRMAQPVRLLRADKAETEAVRWVCKVRVTARVAAAVAADQGLNKVMADKAESKVAEILHSTEKPDRPDVVEMLRPDGLAAERVTGLADRVVQMAMQLWL